MIINSIKKVLVAKFKEIYLQDSSDIVQNSSVSARKPAVYRWSWRCQKQDTIHPKIEMRRTSQRLVVEVVREVYIQFWNFLWSCFGPAMILRDGSLLLMQKDEG